VPLEIVHRAAPCRNVPVTFTLDLMNTVEREVQSWRRVATELGIEFEAPYVLEHADARFTFLGHLPQFGSERGMLLMLQYNHEAAEAAFKDGFGFSCLELGEEVDGEDVVELLQDWTWTSRTPAPRWYREV